MPDFKCEQAIVLSAKNLGEKLKIDVNGKVKITGTAIDTLSNVTICVNMAKFS